MQATLVGAEPHMSFQCFTHSTQDTSADKQGIPQKACSAQSEFIRNCRLPTVRLCRPPQLTTACSASALPHHDPAHAVSVQHTVWLNM